MQKHHATSLEEMGDAFQSAKGLELGSVAQARPVVGDYPREPSFFFGCDGVFFQSFCIPLLASIAEHSPGVRCHVHLMDAKPGIESLASPLRLSLSYTREQTGLTDKQARWDYYNAFRFVRFAEALSVNPGPLWIADVDGLATKDVRPLLRSTWPLALRMRPGRSEAHNHVSACLVLGTAESRPFFEYVSAFIRSRPLFWGIDQLALLAAYVALKPSVELIGPDLTGVEEDKPGMLWFTGSSSKLRLLTDDTPYALEFRRVAQNYLNLLASSR